MFNDAFEKHYNQLIGWTISAYREEEDDMGGDPLPILTLKKKGYQDLEMEILCDPEGNGPGFAYYYHPEG